MSKSDVIELLSHMSEEFLFGLNIIFVLHGNLDPHNVLSVYATVFRIENQITWVMKPKHLKSVCWRCV